ncbi:hypothetical protein Cni_G19382 [Canna indica]|uniref:Uncharacterized protein n=1 Tax=Canna indica TaxID=4628 RepID=A0AAQ3KKG2_9LILI|nr:hypothetical protein Cni_G19382 [Canna indica]
MLTGDTSEAARHAQTQLDKGIEEVHTELLPKDKVKLIGNLKNREGSTAMVRDGMNNAPALAMADVGILMGVTGFATETIHIILMWNDRYPNDSQSHQFGEEDKKQDHRRPSSSLGGCSCRCQYVPVSNLKEEDITLV